MVQLFDRYVTRFSGRRAIRALIVGLLITGAGSVGMGLEAPTASAAGFQPIARGDIIASLFNGQVNEYSPTGTFVQTLIPRASGPTGSAFDAAGNLYVAEFGTNDILKVDGQTGAVSVFSNNTILADGTAFNSPESIAFGPGYTKMYVSDANRFGAGGGIHILDPATGKSIGFLPLPSSSGSEGTGESDWLAFSPSGGLFMTNENRAQGIMQVDQGTGDIIQPSLVGNLPSIGYALSFDPSGDIWLSDTSSIQEYSSTGSLLRTITNSSFDIVFSAVFNPPFNTMYAGDVITGAIYTYDLQGVLQGTFNVGSGVNGLSVAGTVLPGTGSGGGISLVSPRVLEGQVGQPVSPSAVASFGETSSTWQATNYQADVDWGDGSHSAASIIGGSNGCVSLGPSGSLVLASCFDVRPPAHAYAGAGVDEYTVHLRRSDGATSDFSGEAEVSGPPTASLTTNQIRSRTGVLTWLNPNGSWFGCTATVLHSRSRELIATAAHCGVPSGHTTALWFAPGFNVSGGVCQYPDPATGQEPALPDLTKCPTGDIPYGVWVGGTVVPNPAAGGDSGYGGSNDQTFVRLDGTHCRDASANCDEAHPEDAVGGDFMDFFYWQLTQPLTFPAPISGATFGYPIDLGQGASSSTQTFAQTLQVCANRQGTTNPFTDTAVSGLVPQPGFALSNCSYNGQAFGQCQWSLNPVRGCSMAGVSGSPYVTDDGPLADAVAAVNTGIAPDTKPNHFDTFAGVPGLITALSYLEADGIPPQ